MTEDEEIETFDRELTRLTDVLNSYIDKIHELNMRHATDNDLIDAYLNSLKELDAHRANPPMSTVLRCRKFYCSREILESIDENELTQEQALEVLQNIIRDIKSHIKEGKND